MGDQLSQAGKRHVVAIIQARMGSSRLPGKVLSPLVGKPVLWHIVHRLRQCRTIDEIAIATSTISTDDPIIEFAQRAGSLRSYLDDVLGATEDVTLFEYMKKSNRETGPALVGIELARKDDLNPLLERMDKAEMIYQHVSDDHVMFRFLL